MAHTSALKMGDEALRAENISSMIKQMTESKFVMKQIVMNVNSSSWQETYYRESVRRLGSGTTGLSANVEGVPRGAAFPVDKPFYDRLSAFQKKHAMEVEVFLEDELSDNIDIIQRSLETAANGVQFSVDRDIYDTLNATGINALAIAAGETWDNSTRSARLPQEHLARSVALIHDAASSSKHYRPDFFLVNTLDWAYVWSNDFIMDAFSEGAAAPGAMQAGPSVVGKLAGLNVLVDPVVPTDEAYVLQSKVCGTYRVLQDIKTAVKEDEGIKKIIRVWEIGVPFVTDPLSITRITNTRT